MVFFGCVLVMENYFFFLGLEFLENFKFFGLGVGRLLFIILSGDFEVGFKFFLMFTIF